ncbi:MAG: hypothetical protein O7E52_15160 [Candidatus Poribacteria bacterium]|nr:hypothetical protein [Candidatus Poribacteria bacterium]
MKAIAVRPGCNEPELIEAPQPVVPLSDFRDAYAPRQRESIFRR